MTPPTKAELAAVRAVLFEPSRAQRLADDGASLSVLLNLHGQSSSGVVTWWVPSTGTLAPHVVEAAGRCRSISSAYTQMSKELSSAKVNATDKANLRGVLDAMAAWWDARARALADPHRPTDPTGTARAISQHVIRALELGSNVARYFEKPA